jgi:hypothetical protein
MDSIQFSEFSTNGVTNSDTFDIWRKKTNGIIGELSNINDSIAPLFYSTGQNTSTLLRTVTLDSTQSITGTKTFEGGTATAPILKIGSAGLYESEDVLRSTKTFSSNKIVAVSQIQLGTHTYSVPSNNPPESSILEKTGSDLSWKTLSSIISVIQAEGATNVVTTNIVSPVGSIIDYAITTGTAPSNWLRCSGLKFLGADYPELATLLLNTYGPIYVDEAGTVEAGSVSYNSTWWYTLPSLSGKIIKAKVDSVINTFINRGNVLDIIKDGTSLESLSIANGGTAALNLRHDNTLRIDSSTRELGVSPFSVGSDKIISNSIDPSKLSYGGPSWDAGSSALYEGSDPNNRHRVATREYVDSKIFKTGPVKKLVSRPASSPYSSAPAFGEFCYINHDGVPVITGANRQNRFGWADKFSHCEMPLPDNRIAVELHVSYNSMCALDDQGELWTIGNQTHNLFNIVPYPGIINREFNVATWTKAYTPLYNYSTGNKIRKVIVSPDVSINNTAVIDTSNRLWIAGYNQYGILGRGNSGTTTTHTATKTNGEDTPVLTDVLDAFLIGSWDGSVESAVCIALKVDGIYMSGYGAQGQNGRGNTNAINSTFNMITLPDITDYSGCQIYGSGEDAFTSIFVKTPNNLVYAWGYNGNNIFGDGTTINRNSPTLIFNDPDLNVDRVYTTSHIGGQGAAYISGQKNNTTVQRGSDISSATAQHLLGTSISCDDSGNIVAIGAPGANGRVQCYRYSTSGWAEYGPLITPTETSSLFGQSVSMNSSGSRVCIGAPDGHLVGTSRFGSVRVYDYSSVTGTWSQRQMLFNGELAGSKLGASVALSGDGNTFIAGAPSYNGNIGRVYVRRITSTGSDPIGDAITGTAVNQQCGTRVAINSSGTVIAVASNGISNAGVIRVYSLIGNNWSQIGGDIVGRAASDTAINISLNGTGTLLAVGAPNSDVSGSNSGTTRVYSYDSQSLAWIQLGNDITGQTVNEYSGSAVAFSRDGSILAVGAPNADTLGLIDNGVVRLFKYADNKWQLLTANISGVTGSEKFGSTLAISANGTNIISGSPTWSTNRGFVRSVGFTTSPTISYEVWCTGKNTGNKFSFVGDTATWREVGALPAGYDIQDFWPGNGYYSDSVNFIKARRQTDGLHYLFVAGSNTRYESGYGNNTPLTTWTRLNLQSSIVDRIINIQSVSPYGGEDYTVLHLNDGTLYFAGYNAYMIDANLQNNTHRTDFTRIK